MPRLGNTRNGYTILLGNPLHNIQLEDRGGDGGIRSVLGRYEGRRETKLTEDRDEWRALY
jgi:hypothetical protein